MKICWKNLLRLCYLRRFGYLIASLSKSQLSHGGQSFFDYDAAKFNFFPTSSSSPTETSQQKTDQSKQSIESLNAESKTASSTQTAAAKDTRKFQLMKNMAQLRLEVIDSAF